MTIEELKKLLAEKGMAGLTPEILAKVGASWDQVLAVLQASVKAEFEAGIKPISDRLNEIKAGGDNGVAGAWDGKKPIFKYEEAPASLYSSHFHQGDKLLVPRCVASGSDTVDAFKRIMSGWKEGKPFRIKSSIDPDLAATTSAEDPSDAGVTLPAPFEEALVDTYIAASGWLTRIKQIRGTGRSFYYPVRPRNLDLSADIKTLTSIVATMVPDNGLPVETKNTPWGYKKGEARTYACWGRITREMLRGNPRSVNDFMQEMSRGISDIVSYDAFRGRGNANNEMLGWLNQVDADSKPEGYARTTNSVFKRADLIKILKDLHDYFKSGAFWMGRSEALLTFAEEVDSQNRPLFLNWQQSISDSIEPPQLFGYPVVRNWQAPPLGTKGDLTLVSAAALWVYFQEAVSIRSSDQVEWLAGNLLLAADIGWSTGVTLNEGIKYLKTNV